MLRLSTLDYAVIVLFISAILALGFSARLRDSSVLQFLAAGRRLSLPGFVATLVCTWYGGILGMGESVKAFGLGAWVLLGVPYYAFALLYALFFAKRIRGADQISLPERLENRFGKTVGLLSAILVYVLAIPAAHVLMLGVLVQTLTGWNLTTCVIVATLGGTLFLYKGGLLADVRASLLAFAMMYLGFGLIVGWCLFHHPFAQTIASLPPTSKHWDGGGGWTMILSFFILGAWTLVDPGFHQRVASAESPATGQKGVFVCILFWMLFDFLTITTGLYAMALMKPVPSGLSIFPLFGSAILPHGLLAIFLCGMLGTILCAMVGYTLVSGATVGREIVSRVFEITDDQAVKRWTRMGLAFSCVIAVIVGLTINSVVDLWYAWGGAAIGALLLPVCIAYDLLPLRSSRGIIGTSIVLASVVAFGLLIYGQLNQNPYLIFKIFGNDFSVGTLLPGLLVSIIVIAVGEIVLLFKN